MTTWRKKLARLGIDPNEVIAVNPPDLDWDREFDDDYGEPSGVPFVAWTPTKVVFCICYDGSEWLGSVPRDPNQELDPHHFGGG